MLRRWACLEKKKNLVMKKKILLIFCLYSLYKGKTSQKLTFFEEFGMAKMGRKSSNFAILIRKNESEGVQNSLEHNLKL